MRQYELNAIRNAKKEFPTTNTKTINRKRVFNEKT